MIFRAEARRGAQPCDTHRRWPTPFRFAQWLCGIKLEKTLCDCFNAETTLSDLVAEGVSKPLSFVWIEKALHG